MMALGLPMALLLIGLFGSSRDLTTRAKPVRRVPARRVRVVRRRAPAAPAPAPARRMPAPAPARRPTRAIPVSRSTAVRIQPAPWPQVVPSGLPAFPGAAWRPDDPPGPGVVGRARQLLRTLWAHGAGTFKTEQTSGRWITYRATPMGKRKGVVAFKLVKQPAAMVPPPTSPRYAPADAPARVVPASVRTAKPSRVALPTLRRGSRGKSVRLLQRKLGITSDGIFGAGTQRSVIAYQRSKGLVPDGVVGRKTWGALFAG